MHIARRTRQSKMPEKRNFLMLAICMGAAGVVIGAITIWSMAPSLFGP